MLVSRSVLQTSCIPLYEGQSIFQEIRTAWQADRAFSWQTKLFFCSLEKTFHEMNVFGSFR
ncbi:hypothetical protein AKJ16_DCAP26606 [Drosera capensis]